MPICNNHIVVPIFSVGKIINWVGKFMQWAGLIYWVGKVIWPIPGKVKLLLISGKKSASLLDHISRFLSHQFVTWYFEKYFQNKNCEAFLSVHE